MAVTAPDESHLHDLGKLFEQIGQRPPQGDVVPLQGNDLLGVYAAVGVHADCDLIQIIGTAALQGNKFFHRRQVNMQYRRIDISERIKPVWEILPKRWVVERTFSWMNNDRRLSKDYEITTDSEKSFVYISHMHTLLKRLL